MYKLTFLVVLALTACNGSSPENDVSSVSSSLTFTDSLEYYTYYIQGRWRRSDNIAETMEISGGSISYFGLYNSRYQLINVHEMVVYNPDDTIDSMQVHFRRDTLVMQNKTAYGESLYVRRS